MSNPSGPGTDDPSSNKSNAAMLEQLTQAVQDFVQSSGLEPLQKLVFTPQKIMRPRNEGYPEPTYCVATIDPACLKGLPFASGEIRARGDQVWVVLKKEEGDPNVKIGVNARLSWGRPNNGTPIILDTDDNNRHANNRRALRQLALALDKKKLDEPTVPGPSTPPTLKTIQPLPL